MKPKFALTLFAFLLLSGCGTISRGTSADVAVDVEPRDAAVETSLGQSCKGSCAIRAPRNRDFTITASAEGYQPQTVSVGRRVSLAGAGAVARNIAGPMVVGVGTDLYTGAAYDHHPNPAVIRLVPLEKEDDPAPAETAPTGDETPAGAPPTG